MEMKENESGCFSGEFISTYFNHISTLYQLYINLINVFQSNSEVDYET
jgi:hypothetical protein